MSLITNDFYDNRTYCILLSRLTQEEIHYIETIDQSMESFLILRWNTIINSFPHDYYNMYASMSTNQERNDWFERYLNLPSHDMTQMPDIV